MDNAIAHLRTRDHWQVYHTVTSEWKTLEANRRPRDSGGTFADQLGSDGCVTENDSLNGPAPPHLINTPSLFRFLRLPPRTTFTTRPALARPRHEILCSSQPGPRSLPGIGSECHLPCRTCFGAAERKSNSTYHCRLDSEWHLPRPIASV